MYINKYLTNLYVRAYTHAQSSAGFGNTSERTVFLNTRASYQKKKCVVV